MDSGRRTCSIFAPLVPFAWLLEVQSPEPVIPGRPGHDSCPRHVRIPVIRDVASSDFFLDLLAVPCPLFPSVCVVGHGQNPPPTRVVDIEDLEVSPVLVERCSRGRVEYQHRRLIHLPARYPFDNGTHASEAAFVLDALYGHLLHVSRGALFCPRAVRRSRSLDKDFDRAGSFPSRRIAVLCWGVRL